VPGFEQWAKFRHFRLAVAIEEHGSILHAANALNLSQPTASKLLQDLESSLNGPLFIRSNRGVEITELGREFVRHGRVILAQLSQTAQSFDALASGADGRISLGTLLTAATYLLPQTLIRLRKTRPGISVSIVEGTNDKLMPRLIAGELDIVLGRLSDIRNDVDQEALYEDELCIVGRRGHPLANRKKVSLEALAKAEWILPPPETALRKQFESLFHDARLNAPRPIVESVSILSNRFLLMGTDMLGVWSRTVMEDGPDREDLTVIDAAAPIAVGPIGISRRRGAQLSPAAEALIVELRATAQEMTQRPLGPLRPEGPRPNGHPALSA
jgi:DNA-binding transcriptional LysR family regulator